MRSFKKKHTKIITKIGIAASFLILSSHPIQAEDISAKIEQKIHELEPPNPNVKPLFDFHLRDVTIIKGPNKAYYLTGTTDDNWGVNEGIRVWRSDNLTDWKLLGDDGFVWTFERDGTKIQRKIKEKNGTLRRGAWAPEIHYLNNTFYIPFFIAGNNVGGVMLKSSSGKAEGPYEIVARDTKFGTGIDQTLFQDPKNSTIYNIWGPGRVKRMLPDMSDLQDKNSTFLKDAQGKQVGYEGVNIFEKNGTYYLMAAEWNGEGPQRGHYYRNTDLIRRSADGRYDAMIATSKNLLGPYSASYVAIPHAGHNMIFEDHDGNLWSTMFGNDEAGAPFREDPALVPLYIDNDGKIKPKHPYPLLPPVEAKTIYVSKLGNNQDGQTWHTAYTSINAAINAAQPETQIWIKADNYNETLKIENKQALWLYSGFKGNETARSQRQLNAATSIIDVTDQARRAAEIINSEYIRLDGFAFMGGHNNDKNSNGAGLYIQGGGEHVTIVNSEIKQNFAAGNGAGAYVTDGASPLFINTRFEHNIAFNNGGAIAINANDYNGYHTRFYNVVMDSNQAKVDGGAIHANTKHLRTGTVRIVNSIISNNKTQLNCGNVCLRGGSVLFMLNSIAYKNIGMSNAVAFTRLGSIPAQHRLINNIFVGNQGGALIYADGFARTVKNKSELKKGHKNGWVNLVNNTFYQNNVLALTERSFDTYRIKSAAQINQRPGSEGNIDLDPKFVDADNGDFNLSDASQLKDIGSAESGFPLDIKGKTRYAVPFNHEQAKISLGVHQY